MERAVEGDADDVPPFLEGHVLDGLLPAPRGVVDEVVDAAELLQRGLGHGVDGGRVDHIGNGDHRFAALALDLFHHGIGLGAIAAHIDHDRSAG